MSNKNHLPLGEDLPRTQVDEITGANFSENRRGGRLLGTFFSMVAERPPATSEMPQHKPDEPVDPISSELAA